MIESGDIVCALEDIKSDHLEVGIVDDVDLYYGTAVLRLIPSLEYKIFKLTNIYKPSKHDLYAAFIEYRKEEKV